MQAKLVLKYGNKGFLHIIEAVISFLIVISYIMLVLSGIRINNKNLLYEKEKIISKEMDSLIITNTSMIFCPQCISKFLTVFGMKKIELYQILSKYYFLNNSCINITTLNNSFNQELDIFCKVCKIKITGPSNTSLTVFDFYNIFLEPDTNYSICSYGSKTLIYLRNKKNIYSYGNSSLTGNINTLVKLVKTRGSVYLVKVFVS